MCFQSKEVIVSAIKQYHIDQGFKFVVIESKIDKYMVPCINYGNDCHWQLRASFSKVRQQWEIKNDRNTSHVLVNYSFIRSP